MDTNKNKNNSNNRMQKPRFNFTWLYILLIAGLAFMIFTRHDTSASRSVDYTTFKDFVTKGYVADVTVNKDNNTLTLAINSKYEKQVYGAVNKNKKPARIKVEFGSIDNLESYLDEQNKEGNFTEGLEQGILRCGEKLKTYFPYQTDDTNEIPDDISYENN